MFAGIASGVRSPSEALVPAPPILLAALFTALFGASLAISAPETKAASQPEDRSPLVEAAARQRARILASRRARGPAPRFTDRDLGVSARGAAPDGGSTSGARPVPSAVRPPEAPAVAPEPGSLPDPNDDSTPGAHPVPDADSLPSAGPIPEADSTQGAGPVPSAIRPPEAPAVAPEPESLPGPEPDPESARDRDLNPGADTTDPRAHLPDISAARADKGERASELRERLLDIESSLTAIGASGLPHAVRNPNRFLSGLDAHRLLAERDEIRRELEALAPRKR